MTKSDKETRVFNIALPSVRVEQGTLGRAPAAGAALQDANSSCDT